MYEFRTLKQLLNKIFRRISCFGLRVYELLGGHYSKPLPWHIYWLGVKNLYVGMEGILSQFEGRVLDVGSGDRVYSRWIPDNVEYIGLDVDKNSEADILVEQDIPWPFENNSFDGILCTQTLEHVKEIDLILSEIKRVLKPGGLLIITAPFIFSEHGKPDDYRRFSLFEMERLFSTYYDILELKRLGGVGTTMATLVFHWITDFKPTRILSGLLLPLWLMFTFLVNMICLGFDAIDNTDSFYLNVLLVARKKILPNHAGKIKYK